MATSADTPARAPEVASRHELIRVQRRTCEQPQGHERRAAEAAADDLPSTASAYAERDNVLIVVDDLEAAVELEDETQVEGGWVDSVAGLDGVRADIAMMRTPGWPRPG